MEGAGVEKVNKTYTLSAAVCDEVADTIDEFCATQPIGDKEALRCRVRADYALYYWFDNGFEGSELNVRMGRRFGTPYVTLRIQGPKDNPYAHATDEMDDFNLHFTALQVSMGFKPDYRYMSGTNRLMFMLKRKPMNQLQLMFFVLVASWLCGAMGQFLPDTVREGLLTGFIQPLYETFFNVLTCIAGPMVFLSVAWGIYSIGDVQTFGRIGKRTIAYFLGAMFVATVCVSPLFIVLGPGLSGDNQSGGGIGSLFDLILDIIPPNIVQPFIDGNTLQIIFLAVFVAFGLLYLGNQTEYLAETIGQINVLVNYHMGLISAIVPYVIFLVVVNMIYSNTLATALGMWKFLLVVMVAILVTAAFFLLYTAIARKVDPRTLARKCAPSFMIAVTTASSAATFPVNRKACIEKFGIDNSLASFGLPLGMVTHRPIYAIHCLLIAFYFAGQYEVSCNIVWIVKAVIVCCVLAVASPPVPGGGAVIYTMLFAQLGIPTTGIALALAVDLVTDFIVTAFEMFALLMTTTNLAADLDMCDKEVLRAP